MMLAAAVYRCVYNSVVHMFTHVHYSYLHRNVDVHTIVVVILRIVIIGRLLSIWGSWGILISVKIVSIITLILMAGGLPPLNAVNTLSAFIIA